MDDVDELDEEVARVEQVNADLRAYLESPRWADLQEKARRIAESRTNAVERLNASLAIFEQVVVDRFAGKASAIEFDERHALVFWKAFGKWGFYVVGDDARLTPLKNASLGHRIRSAHLLRDLVVQLEEEDG